MPANDNAIMGQKQPYFADINQHSNKDVGQHGLFVDSNFFDPAMSFQNFYAVFASLFAKINDGIFILDDRLRFVCLNQPFLNMTGLTQNEVLGQRLDINDKRYRPHLQQALQSIRIKLEKQQSVSTNLILSNGAGLEVATWLDIAMCPLANNRVVFAGVLTTLNALPSQQVTILSDGHYDELTDLPNYDSFYALLKTYLNYYNTSPEQHSTTGVLLRINIDKLQSFNVSLGIENTNTLIQCFVKRVKSLKVPGICLGALSRFGGDSFAAIILVDDMRCAQQFLQHLTQLCEIPFSINNQSIYLQLSIGLSTFPNNGNDAQTLLLQAESALKQARLVSDDNFVWYHANQQQNRFKNIHLHSAFKSALSNQQIITYFQPKLCFEHPQLPMFEALVRWKHPTLGLLQPKDFLEEVLDKSSQPLFETIIFACIDQALAWRDIGYNCFICVNIDSRQLISEKFIQFIEATLQQYAWLPELISFEITEISKIHDESKAQCMLSTLRHLGFMISIDDFGTGFAALQYLIKYPIHILKIDRLFITDILTDPKKQVVVKAVIDMAHSLSIQALAEGVASAEEIDYLRALGCDFVQGYGFHPPMCSEDTTKWLVANYTANYLP